MVNLIISAFLKKPTCLDHVYIDMLESWVCTHQGATGSMIYEDRTDFGGDVGHIVYYCKRCNAHLGSDY